jgi:hypothetical protein
MFAQYLKNKILRATTAASKFRGDIGEIRIIQGKYCFVI